jgi:hypothetical protein
VSIECDEDRARGGTGSGRDWRMGYAKGSQGFRNGSQPRAIGDLAPARSAIEPEGDQANDLFEDFGQGARTVDVLKDVAAALFELGHLASQGSFGLRSGSQRGCLAAYLPFQRPGAGATGEDYDQQHADEQNEVANIQQDGGATTAISSNERSRILKGTSSPGVIAFASTTMQMPVTRAFAPSGTFIIGGSGLPGWWVVVNGGEELSVDAQHILILRSLSNLGHHFTFRGNQILLVADG